MNKVIAFLLGIVLLSSCATKRSVARWIAKHPEAIETKTERVLDTVRIKDVRIVNRDSLVLKEVIKTDTDTIFMSENEFLEAWAEILALDESKPEEKQLTVKCIQKQDTIVKYIYQPVEKEVKVTKYISAPIPKWKCALMYLGMAAIPIILLLLRFLFRRP